MKYFILLLSILSAFNCLVSEERQQPSLKIDIFDTQSIEILRLDKNKKTFLSNEGDKWLFELGKEFIVKNDEQKILTKFAKEWFDPKVSQKDIKLFYQYFAGLAATKSNNEEIKNIRITLESPYNNEKMVKERIPTDFIESSFEKEEYNKSENPFDDVGIQYYRIIQKHDKESKNIGFYITGTKSKPLTLKFLFRSDKDGKVDLETLKNKCGKEKRIIADFPGPMHTGSGKLIELGMQDGNIVNWIFSGGRRRSGFVIMDREGNVFFNHIHRVVYKEKFYYLSESVDDLNDFLQIAQKDKLSVFMEMLLVHSADGRWLEATSKQEEHGSQRRLLTWGEHGLGLLVLDIKEGVTSNIASWVSFKLGFEWAVYLDVMYYDGAAIYTGKELKRKEFFFRDQPKPYHRLLLCQ